MREILFRAKPNNSNEWVYGDLTSHRTVSPKNGKFIHCKDKITGQWGNFRVKSETIGQYTGLCDKNGKKIFEGDILLVSGVQKVVVSFEDGLFVVSHYAINLLKERTLESEVIGNIHDNPELLGGDNA